jgi:hypothetical protein
MNDAIDNRLIITVWIAALLCGCAANTSNDTEDESSTTVPIRSAEDDGSTSTVQTPYRVITKFDGRSVSVFVPEGTTMEQVRTWHAEIVARERGALFIGYYEPYPTGGHMTVAINDGDALYSWDEASEACRNRFNRKERSLASKFPIDDLLPRPIRSEEDVQDCLAAADEWNEFRKYVAEGTGVVDLEPSTKRLNDCFVQYDDSGYTKFYPGKVRTRLTRFAPDSASLYVFAGDGHTVIIMNISELEMMISCFTASGDQDVHVSLSRYSTAEPFQRDSDWWRLNEPDMLEDYCLRVYSDFEQLIAR